MSSIWLLMREVGAKHEREFRPLLAFTAEDDAKAMHTALRRMVLMRDRDRQEVFRLSPQPARMARTVQIDLDADVAAIRIGDKGGLASDYDLVEVPLR